jgi:hypothetical protein
MINLTTPSSHGKNKSLPQHPAQARRARTQHGVQIPPRLHYQFRPPEAAQSILMRSVKWSWPLSCENRDLSHNNVGFRGRFGGQQIPVSGEHK